MSLQWEIVERKLKEESQPTKKVSLSKLGRNQVIAFHALTENHKGLEHHNSPKWNPNLHRTFVRKNLASLSAQHAAAGTFSIRTGLMQFAKKHPDDQGKLLTLVDNNNENKDPVS